MSNGDISILKSTLDNASLTEMLTALARQMYADDKADGVFSPIPDCDSEAFRLGYTTGVASTVAKMLKGDLNFSVKRIDGKKG